jgi:uncharacterized DUF497 family protein
MLFEWNSDKNECLKRERSISFEQIVFHLAAGDIWKATPHPNQKDYAGQMIYFVNVDGYIYLVPHVVVQNRVFLKTIIPSRKATKAFKEEGDAHEGG